MGLRTFTAAVGAALIALSAVSASPTQAVTVLDDVDGYIYRDIDNDGVRDAQEPPIPGVVLRSGERSTISDAQGRYSFNNVSDTINIRADAGWFRSQCASSYSGPTHGDSYTIKCPDPGWGAGPDQDFQVGNQLLTATAAPGTDASLGLSPDWVGAGYAGFTTDPTAATSKDPALRLSPGYRLPGAENNCLRAVCRPGETQWVLAQWLNQGTSPLRRLRTVVVAPTGSQITQIAPYTGHGLASGHSIRGFRVKDMASGDALAIGAKGWLSASSARVRLVLRGKLLPAGGYLASIGFRVNADAPFSDGNNDGVPDCSADTGEANPGQSCDLATDFGPGSLIAWGAITKVRGGLDQDAAWCPQIPESCAALGVHDKTKPGDSNDAGAWKVDAP